MHSIWVVAKNTISQALRMKVALLVIIMLVLLLPLMGLDVTGDGTLKGKLQTFAYNGLMLMSILLCLFTIIISTFSLSNDLKYKQLYLVLTKPICRFQVVCGKLLGVIVLDIIMLSIFAGIIFGLMIIMPKMYNDDDTEIVKAYNEFFSARATREIQVDKDKLMAEVNKRYQQRKEAGDLPTDMTELQIKREFYSQELKRDKAVVLGGRKKWEFSEVKPLKKQNWLMNLERWIMEQLVDNNELESKGEYIFIRYKYAVDIRTLDESITGEWFIGDDRKEGQYTVRQSDTPYYRVARRETVDKICELPIPADAVAEDGYLSIEFYNPYQNGTVVIPQEVQVLYRSGTFTGNFFRSVLVIFARLVFLAALGVSLSTWLSFPVAVLVCTVAFVTGMMNGFIMDSFDTLGQSVGLIYSFTFKPLLWLLPKFDGEFNPINNIVGAESVSWVVVSKTFGIMVAIKSAILTLVGVWFFSNREIAKIIV